MGCDGEAVPGGDRGGARPGRGGDCSRAGGNVVAGAALAAAAPEMLAGSPMLGTALAGAAQGALAPITQPGDNFTAQKLGQAGIGAVAGPLARPRRARDCRSGRPDIPASSRAISWRWRAAGARADVGRRRALARKRGVEQPFAGHSSRRQRRWLRRPQDGSARRGLGKKATKGKRRRPFREDAKPRISVLRRPKPKIAVINARALALSGTLYERRRPRRTAVFAEEVAPRLHRRWPIPVSASRDGMRIQRNERD